MQWGPPVFLVMEAEAGELGVPGQLGYIVMSSPAQKKKRKRAKSNKKRERKKEEREQRITS
jgi:hypothetical protein